MDEIGEGLKRNDKRCVREAERKGEKEVRNRITSVMYDRVTRRSKESNF